MQCTNHKEGLHLIFLPCRYFINVDNTSVPTTLDTTVLFNRLEDIPAVLPVLHVARKPEGDKEGFYCLGPAPISV